MKPNMKICFAASSGGHFEQLLMLKPLMDRYDSFIVSERTEYEAAVKGKKMYLFLQVNRKERLLPLKMACNAILALRVLLV